MALSHHSNSLDDTISIAFTLSIVKFSLLPLMVLILA
eukprot:CAMPEP_0203713854 /NCGR_PEP_ID=MMETSP0091-20130426/70776_1 /ASSEMBLY_ACC=CAM_ASM_001089 /TAXON_ID=426623 /ORGANISM="Chaetoceros affinis, Strain CCMP159" /LENGTH=36 /DNA_ID= /DNA_START= /DNA_END= /DNA_ORIENTATION=